MPVRGCGMGTLALAFFHWWLLGSDRTNHVTRGRMERSEYDKLDRLEDRMWWFTASRRNLLMLSRRQMLLEDGGRAILDAGCGTGGFLSQLANCYPNRALFGLDTDLL